MATKTQKFTNLEMRQFALLEADEQACALTGYRLEDVATYKYETGLAYLEHMIKDPDARAYLEGTREYWNWWKNQWMLRDEAFLPPLCQELLDNQDAGIPICRSDLREAYNIVHSVDILLDTLEADSFNLACSFSTLIAPLVQRMDRPRRAA